MNVLVPLTAATSHLQTVGSVVPIDHGSRLPSAFIPGRISTRRRADGEDELSSRLGEEVPQGDVGQRCDHPASHPWLLRP